MNTIQPKFISLVDLGMAYRKAKVDLFYSSRSCKTILSKFESQLSAKLKAIRELLLKGESPAVGPKSWTLVPKEIKDTAIETNLISSDPQSLWQSICQNPKRKSAKVRAEFRIMEQLSADFHVFAALWINKLGHKFEEKLSDCARGNRLRRGKSKKINPLSLGSTMPYLFAYCKWRDDAFETIRNTLDQDKSVVAVTADVSSFYHNLDVRFMLNDEFLSKIGVELNENEHDLHELFIGALHKWAQTTPLKRGLPVGLAASSIIANVAMFELDQLIEKEVVPLYYGRYVDDIILVMENGSEFNRAEDVWDWLINRLDGALKWKKDQKVNKSILQYRQSYLEDSEIIFTSKKNKIFLLSGASGHSVLDSIRQEVQSRSSEWRSLPNLPNDSTCLESMLLTAIQKDGISSDSLRKADKVSVRRAGFALKLRDVEAYSRALLPEIWEPQRHAFLTAFIRHVVVLPTIFDFFTYLPRVLSLSVSCADFNHFRQILDGLNTIIEQLNVCKNSIKASKSKTKPSSNQILMTFKENLVNLIEEAVESSFPLRLSKDSKNNWNDCFSEAHPLYDPKELPEIKDQQQRYLRKDLAYRPLKQYLMIPPIFGKQRYPILKKTLKNFDHKTAASLLQKVVVNGCTILLDLSRLSANKRYPSGMLFPTRPFGIHDLYLLHKDPFSTKGRKEIEECLLALRGFKPENKLPSKGNKSDSPIDIPVQRGKRKTIRIAITSWETKNDSWIASVGGKNDPDLSRLDRLNRLLNSIICCHKRPDYLIFPELSIPAHWFLAIAGKLQTNRISLICGIQYLHGPKNTVHNQVWAALSHSALGFPTSMIYRQDKQNPALHEEKELHQVNHKVLAPQLEPWSTPSLINHGGFQFAVLVCSELTNISYRNALRGYVDALFVPEWNQDTDTFNSLVESAALDIHAYIVQCNHRQFGDSRIRAPYKDSWMRDIVRIKGGIEDYFVTGEIDIHALRNFQSNHRSPAKPFKPVPDGFKIAPKRKTLASGNTNEQS